MGIKRRRAYHPGRPYFIPDLDHLVQYLLPELGKYPDFKIKKYYIALRDAQCVSCLQAFNLQDVFWQVVRD
jgi:hypothetical protein